jgi:hypothetical protein
MATIPDNRSLGELIAELSAEMSTLIRKELELARVELTSKAGAAARNGAAAATGGVVAYSGLLAFIAGAILGLVRLGMAAWLAAFIIGVLTMGGGALLIYLGVYRLRHMRFTPRVTIETLKEDAKWTRRQGA